MPSPSSPRPQDRPDAHDIADAVEALVGVIRRHQYPDMFGPWAVAMLASKLGVKVTIGDQDNGVNCLDLLGPIGDGPQWSVTIQDPTTGVNVTSDGFTADTMCLLTGVGRAWVELMTTLLERFPGRRTDVLRAAASVTQEVVDELRRRGLLGTKRRPAST